jgi:hypothetical protein
MKRKLLVGLAAMVFFGAGTAWAQVVSLSGTHQYTKPQGAPATFTETFAVPNSVTDFVLYVQNGNNAKDEVKNFTILLNGQEVLSSRHMTSSKIQVPVTLLPENTLEVTLKGQGGNSLFVDVQGTVVEKK